MSDLKMSDKKESEADVQVAAAPPVQYDITPTLSQENNEKTGAHEEDTKHDLDVTAEDLEEIELKLGQMSIERATKILDQVYKLHRNDPNFPAHVLESMEAFLFIPEVQAKPHEHADLIREMKLEAVLVTENSPYAEVRAVVSNTDDPTMPSFTIRVWLIGIILVVIGAFINQLFAVRQPSIRVSSEVAQLVAYPMGLLAARVLPDWGFTMFGSRHSLNPGAFNKKEHMLITIMANVGYNTPYTLNIILTQNLPLYYNQAYAASFAYQILLGLSTNFLGIGLAGLCRRFLVYPSFCVWPASLVTVALNTAFHTESNTAVPGPFNRMYSMSRIKFFGLAFLAMFVYFWFPGYLFTALSSFNWISWIAPNNATLNNIVGFNNGLGINPWPTFDYNVLTVYDWFPLVLPTFSVVNQFAGMVLSFFVIVAWYWSNSYNTAYLPINSNKTFDNKGKIFDVLKVVDDRRMFDAAKYQEYSQPWMAAGNLVNYLFFFAMYTCTITYVALFHTHELVLGFKGAWRAIRFGKKREEETDDDLSEDIHCRLMRKYNEVPEWWYMIVMVSAGALGIAAVAAWPTYTSAGVVPFGVAMALVFMIPVGIVTAVTGVQPTMNVLAEFIGGAWEPGNALWLNLFKAYGYIVTAQAIYFSNDLKLAHYTKIPPRHTFSAQIVATLVSTFVCTGVINFQLTGIRDICTPEAAFGLTCPGVNTFFTAAVLWGTYGPHKLFGKNGQYQLLLLGFPLGIILPVGLWFARKKWPKTQWLRQIHPVMITVGGLYWAPYNISYLWPAVPLTWLSWNYVKPRYLAFWSKYNYVLAASWSTGIALSAIVIFFAIQMPEVEVSWWGNEVSYEGCEGTACRRLPIPDVGYFGPAPGSLP